MPNAIASLRDAHRAVSDLLDALSADALGWRPEPDLWSATDVLEHLIRTERGMLFSMKRQVEAGENRRDLGAPSPEAFAQLRAFLLTDRKTRVPEGAAQYVAPKGDTPYADLRAEWDALPETWAQALAAIPDGLAEAGLVPHPRAGALTGQDAALFAADHATHHLHQLRRLREHPELPTA